MIEVGLVAGAYTRIGKMITGLFGLMLASSSMVMAETPDSGASPDSAPTAKPAPVPGNANGTDQNANVDSVYVEGKRWLFNRRTRYAHSLPEVSDP